MKTSGRISLIFYVTAIVATLSFGMKAEAAEQPVVPVAVKAPSYKPPMRGAPGMRMGGGTRGVGGMPLLIAIAPDDHAGLTMWDQPSIFWYVSPNAPEGATYKMKIEFTLIDEKNIKPMVEAELGRIKGVGIHRVKLADYGARLQKGAVYEWSVSISEEGASRSQDIIAGGAIQLMEPLGALREKISKADKRDLASIYAEEGFWYDAFSALADMMEMYPNDKSLRDQQEALLTQIGLGGIMAGGAK